MYSVAIRPHAPAARPASLTPDTVAVWLRVSANTRPAHPRMVLDDLAWPDYCLDGFRESVSLEDEEADRYTGDWYCRFLRSRQDQFADARLIKRLTVAGFKILQFDRGVES